MEWLLIIVGIYLLIASIIDWKLKSLPSIFLSSILFVVAFMFPQNVWFGIMTFILAFLLYEAGFFSGIADIKIMTMLGFMVSTINWLFVLILLSVCYGLVWKVFVKWRLPKEKDCAFIPVFLFVYFTFYLLGGLS
jgi:hypothetical protein